MMSKRRPREPRRRRTFARMLTMVLVVIFALSSATWALVSIVGSRQQNAVVATVAGQPITSGQVSRRAALLAVMYGLSPQQLQSAALQQLENAALLGAWAAAHGVAAPTAAAVSTVQSQLQSGMTQYYGSSAAVARAMAQAGVNGTDLTSYATARALENAVYTKVTAGVTVSSAEVAAYYQAHASDFATPAETHVAVIQVATSATAATVLAKIRAGMSFAAAAAAYSTDAATAKNGGDLGFLSQVQLDAQVNAGTASQIMSASVGSIVGPQASLDGKSYLLFSVLGRRPATTPALATIRQQVTAAAENARDQQLYQNLLQSLRTAAGLPGT